MSADRPRSSSDWQRATSFTDLMNYLFPPSANGTSSSSGNRSISQLADEQRQRRSAPGWPGSGPFIGYSTATAPQQSLPPLRSANRNSGAPTGPAGPLPPPSSNQQQVPSLPTSTNATSHASDSILPFGYRRINERVNSPLRSALSSLDEIGHDLDYANSHLRALLDMTAPNDFIYQLPASQSPTFSHTMAARSSGAAGSRRELSRSEDNGRLNKRRKLDSDKTVTPPYSGFRYGRYGQVEPGALTMEIVSCDGGLYSDGSSYAAENILKNDNTVYCTKGNRCNIVLQHQGSTTFSLKELIIKAPGRNYSSPVKEGIVFLAMSRDELRRTDQYQANDFPGPTSSLFHRVEALRARTNRLTRTGSHRRDGHETSDAPLEEIYNLALDGSPSYRPSSSYDHMESLSNQPTFHVLTECSDDDDDDLPGRPGRDRDSRGMGWRGAAGWSPTPLRSRPRLRMPVDDDPAHLSAHLTWDMYRNYDDDDDDYTELYDLGNATLSSPDSPPAEAERPHAPVRSRMDRGREGTHSLAWNSEQPPVYHRAAAHHRSRNNIANNSAATTDRSARDEPPSTLQRAEFHIEMDKNKCTILFDPPVTARYILLKMWNPRQDTAGNIDIQGVVAKGFAGPRYFPAMELR